MERLDRRLASLPAPDLFPLLKRVSALEGEAGWWRGRFPRSPPWLDAAREDGVRASGDAVARFGGREGAGGANRPSPLPLARQVASLLSDVPGPLSAEPFSEALVLSFHSRLAAPRKDGKEEAGRYKGSSPPSPFLRWGLEPEALRSPGWHLVPREMERLVAWTVRSLDPASPYHPLLVIPAFLLEFHALRPFAHGNGRVGRALAALLLFRHHHPGILHVSLDAVTAERQYDLLLALRKAQATRNLPRPDLLPWLSAFLSLLEEHGRRLRRLGERAGREEEMTATEARAMELALSLGEATTAVVSARLGVSRETAKLALARLYGKGMVERMGAGRGCRYRPALPIR